MMSSRLAWQIVSVAAFAATAALVVTLSRGAGPERASLVSSVPGVSRSAPVGARPDARQFVLPRCTASARPSASAAARASPAPHQARARPRPARSRCGR